MAAVNAYARSTRVRTGAHVVAVRGPLRLAFSATIWCDVDEAALKRNCGGREVDDPRAMDALAVRGSGFRRRRLQLRQPVLRGSRIVSAERLDVQDADARRFHRVRQRREASESTPGNTCRCRNTMPVDDVVFGGWVITCTGMRSSSASAAAMHLKRGCRAAGSDVLEDTDRRDLAGHPAGRSCHARRSTDVRSAADDEAAERVAHAICASKRVRPRARRRSARPPRAEEATPTAPEIDGSVAGSERELATDQGELRRLRGLQIVGGRAIVCARIDDAGVEEERVELVERS